MQATKTSAPQLFKGELMTTGNDLAAEVDSLRETLLNGTDDAAKQQARARLEAMAEQYRGSIAARAKTALKEAV